MDNVHSDCHGWRVEVSKRVIVGAAIAFVVLIAAVSFLLGRESRRPRVVAAEPAQIAPAASAPAPSSTGFANDPWAMPATSPAASRPSVAPAPSAAPPRAPAAAPPTPALPTVAADPAIEIRDYFVQIAAIQAGGPAGDPSEMANKLLAAAVNGDASGFDSLIKGIDDGITRAQQVHVPSACEDYQQKLLGLLGESGKMLRDLKLSIARHDTSGLNALAASAGSLQARTDALAAEGRQVKARFGLPN